jgi:hypothetical protein
MGTYDLPDTLGIADSGVTLNKAGPVRGAWRAIKGGLSPSAAYNQANFAGRVIPLDVADASGSTHASAAENDAARRRAGFASRLLKDLAAYQQR